MSYSYLKNKCIVIVAIEWEMQMLKSGIKRRSLEHSSWSQAVQFQVSDLFHSLCRRSLFSFLCAKHKGLLSSLSCFLSVPLFFFGVLSVSTVTFIFNFFHPYQICVLIWNNYANYEKILRYGKGQTLGLNPPSVNWVSKFSSLHFLLCKAAHWLLRWDI